MTRRRMRKMKRKERMKKMQQAGQKENGMTETQRMRRINGGNNKAASLL